MDRKDKFFQELRKTSLEDPGIRAAIKKLRSSKALKTLLGEMWRRAEDLDHLPLINSTMTDVEVSSLLRTKSGTVSGYKGAVQLVADLMFDEEEEEDNA